MHKYILILFSMVSFFTNLSGEYPNSREYPNIAMVTMAIGKEYQKMVMPGTKSKIKYCKKQGYDLILKKIQLDLSRPIPWTKVIVIQNNLSNYDWIFWSDADSIVMNKQIKLESIIDEDYDLIITRDFNDLNSGQFLIRNCEWSHDFLERIYGKTEFIHHTWWENMAIIDELAKNPDDMLHVKVISQRVMNSYAEESNPAIPFLMGYHKGDFIIHFAGFRNEALKKVMIKYGALAD